MNLIYVNPENSSVMEAQVISLLEYYRQVNGFDEILLLQGYKNDREKAALEKKLSGVNLRVIWFKTWYIFTFFRWFDLKSISKVLDEISPDGQTVIHVRGEHHGSLIQQYLHARRSAAKLLIDIRGAAIEQIVEYSSLNILLKHNKKLLSKQIYKKIKSNSNITVVSNALKAYLVTNHGFNPAKICVNPNIADQQFSYDCVLRQKVRDELGIEDRQLVAICSSGGDASWQKDREVIRSLIKYHVQVINLSGKKVEEEGVINRRVGFDQVPGYLAAADMAVLWRDESKVNEVASPSKFSEFACMGLWVIHNGTVSLASDYITENNAGLIINSVEQITESDIGRFSDYSRSDYSILGRKQFGVENIALSYMRTYNQILNAS